MDTNTQPPKSKKKITVTILTLVVIIALVVFAIPNKSEMPANSTTEQTDQVNTATTTGSGKPVSVTLSRKEAIQIYQDRMIRISDQCLPDRFIHARLQKGDRFMLDNDTAKPHTIVFQGTTYKVSPQSYRTIVASTDGYVASTCDQKTATTTVAIVSSIE